MRRKVLENVEKGGSKAETARVFGISVNCIHVWPGQLRETGCLEARYAGRRAKKSARKKLGLFLAKRPGAYPEEIADHFDASIRGVWQACQRYRITRKKRRGSTRSAMKKPARHSLGK